MPERSREVERILFIVPPHIKFENYVNPSSIATTTQKKGVKYGSVSTDMPLGVMSLSAYLKKYAEVETRLIDFSVALNKLDRFAHCSFSDFFRSTLSEPKWTEYRPGIIALSALFTPSYRNVLDIAACCRELFPQAIILAGGGLPTNMYREIFKDSSSFDALCYGEGEKPLLGLVNAVDKKHYLSESPSWITQKKADVNRHFVHDFITDLDEIPFYDYDICTIDDYGMNPAITAYAPVGGGMLNFHVMTSRGCTNRCCFCSSSTVHGRKMRYYSIERVREDFKRLRDRYGAKTIVVQDDHLMADKQRAFAVIDIIKELRLVAVFQNALALYALDRKFLEALKSAGVDQLPLAVESGSERVLREIMHKPLNLSIVQRVAGDCRELGIYTNVNILIGLPGETKKDIEDARAFLKTIYANWFIILVATPLVGTEMLEICLKKNYLKGSYVDCDYKKAIVETEDFTVEYIQEMAYILNLDLNFVTNSDMRLGKYAVALKGFENAIRAKSDHAFAYYYAALCHEKLGGRDAADRYMSSARKIVAESEFWRKYARMFQLPLE